MMGKRINFLTLKKGTSKRAELQHAIHDDALLNDSSGILVDIDDAADHSGEMCNTGDEFHNLCTNRQAVDALESNKDNCVTLTRKEKSYRINGEDEGNQWHQYSLL